MKFFSDRNLTIAISLGIVLGITVGLLAQGPYEPFRDSAGAAKPLIVSFVDGVAIFGAIFLGALKMVVVPLVLFSVASGVANLHGGKEAGRKMAKTLTYFLSTSFLAVGIGILFTNLVAPGKGIDPTELKARLPEAAMRGAEATQAAVASKAPKNLPEFLQQMVDSVFVNPFKSLADMNLIGVVFFSLLLGFMLMLGGEKARPAREFFNSMDDALMRMVKAVIWLAPLGIFALASRLLMSLGPDIIGSLLKYFLTVVLGLATQLLIVYPLILLLICRYKPWRFFVRIKEAMLMAVSTASSAATLPVTLRVVEEKLGVDKHSADFVLPMGATINMDGTALYEAVAAMFVAQMLGADLSLGEQALVFFTATLAAIGAAGIPQAGLVTMVVVFNAIGIPLEWMAIIIVVDRPLDHLRTMVNVTGDAVGSVFLSRSEGELNPGDAAA